MAMGRPVVVSKASATAIDARDGLEVCVAAQAEDYVRSIDGLLRAPEQAKVIGAAARRRVLNDYSWPARLSRIDQYLRLKESCEVT
jgi:glycosyltransferase involved in cell wall biosynthesis